MSFRLSFHLPLLGPTGAHWLDNRSDVSCKESTRQHPVDGRPLSCKQLPCQQRYAEAFSSLPGRCFRLVAHPGETGPTHCPETVAWRGSPRAPSGWVPRNADLRRFSQADLDRIAAGLNGRPRQILRFQTPSRAFAEALR
jgi:hypothetical protein